VRSIYPEPWHAFAEYLPSAEQNDLLASYHKRLMDPDPAIHMPAARRWSVYEGSCSTLLPSPETVAAFGDDRMALGLARMEAHYFVNDIFLPGDSLLDNLARIRHLPTAIVQGRYDVVCPAVTADELHRAWPEARYTVVPDAGHSAMEPGIRSALVEATDRFRALK
jgi:proline iminopeptidase